MPERRGLERGSAGAGGTAIRSAPGTIRGMTMCDPFRESGRPLPDSFAPEGLRVVCRRASPHPCHLNPVQPERESGRKETLPDFLASMQLMRSWVVDLDRWSSNLPQGSERSQTRRSSLGSSRMSSNTTVPGPSRRRAGVNHRRTQRHACPPRVLLRRRTGCPRPLHTAIRSLSTSTPSQSKMSSWSGVVTEVRCRCDRARADRWPRGNSCVRASTQRS